MKGTVLFFYPWEIPVVQYSTVQYSNQFEIFYFCLCLKLCVFVLVFFDRGEKKIQCIITCIIIITFLSLYCNIFYVWWLLFRPLVTKYRALLSYSRTVYSTCSIIDDILSMMIQIKCWCYDVTIRRVWGCRWRPSMFEAWFYNSAWKLRLSFNVNSTTVQ